MPTPITHLCFALLCFYGLVSERRGRGRKSFQFFVLQMVFLDDSGGNIGDNGHVLKLRPPAIG